MAAPAMNGTPPLQAVATLLERAYRLALVLQSPPLQQDPVGEGFVAAELVDVLDEARVALLLAQRRLPPATCS